MGFMKEVLIDFDNKGPIDINQTVNIAAFKSDSEKIQYKFMEGLNGIWSPIQDFSDNNICTWNPKKAGKYMIMVQGKSDNCSNGYDYLGKVEYEVNEACGIKEEIPLKGILNEGDEESKVNNSKGDEKLIKDIIVDKDKVTLGEKIRIKIVSDEDILLCRFGIKEKDEWETLREYSMEKEYVYTANECGSKEILVECKSIDSEKNVDEFRTVSIEVEAINKVEIKNISCKCDSMIVDEELTFSIETNSSSNRPLLYKFFKINKEGKMICIQDFYSKNQVVFKEKQPGDYKLLCLVRDMFSNNAFDDRAIISYVVKPYNKIKINSFKSDIASPQGIGSTINFNTMATGGKTLVYRYSVDGPIKDDSSYRRSSEFCWIPQKEGDYTITVMVRDLSCDKEYEDIAVIHYSVYKKSDRPLRITEVVCSKERRCIVGESINILAKVEGGNKALYSFFINRNGVLEKKIDYEESNWIDFIPESKGEYEIEIKVRDYYSTREYDSSTSVYFKVNDFIPAQIECILTTSKERYLVDEVIEIEAIITGTKNTLVNLVTKINGQEVEKTGFVTNKKFRIKPKCKGKYTFQVFAKNTKSSEEYDSKKELNIYVHEVLPVTSTKVFISEDDITIGKEITLKAISVGGKDVCYQFYIMNNDNWTLVQGYSRKDYYTFIPFTSGEYRVLVLSKSFHKKIEYEDYDVIDFMVR